MRNIGRGLALLFSALAIASCSTVGAGNTQSSTVPANRSSIVSFFSVTTEYGECRQPEKPKMRVVTPPQHGSVRFNWASSSQTALTARCGAVKGMQIIYTPDRGFRGNDSFVAGAEFATFVGESTNSSSKFVKYRFDLTVR